MLTQGDPANSTDILVTYLYKLAFRYGKIDEAAAMSLVMFAVLLAFTIVYAILVMRGREETAVIDVEDDIEAGIRVPEHTVPREVAQ